MTAKEYRTIVVTGASSGIGKETAKAFAAMGWHVIGTGRTQQRCNEAEAEIRAAAAPDAKIDFLRGDTALMSEVKRIAGEIKHLTGRIDVLFNNSGGVRDQRYITSEGTEETFTANHLAPFLLTRLLLPVLKATAAESQPGDVRVIGTSSLAYLTAAGGMNWDDIQHLQGDFPASAVYCEAKLANVLFNHELSKRITSDGIAVQSLIPGVVHTNFASHGDENMQAYLKEAPGLTPEEVARTVVWMATAAETGLPGGRHFYDMKEQEIQPHAADNEASARLWAESEKILASLGY